MKKISKFLMVFLMGTVATTSFTACSDSDDEGFDRENPSIVNGWSGVKSEMWDITNQYVTAVVYPTYSNLADKAEALYDKAVAMQTKYKAGQLTDADVEATCEAFKEAREYWEKSEAFLYGAASDFNIDPHMDSWPLDQSQIANFLSDSKMVNGLYSEDPIAFVNNNNGEFDTALGFHGIEFVLFRDGKARPASIYSGIENYESFKGKNVKCEDELAFLVAVAGDVRDHCYWLEVAWLGQAAKAAHKARVATLGFDTHANSNKGYYYGANMILAGNGYSSMLTINEPLVTLVGASGCGNICNEVAEQKLGQAYRVSTGTSNPDADEPESRDYIESPYSKRSFIDYRDNLYSIKNSLYGNFDQATPNDKSVIKFLEKYNYKDVETLKNALNTAIQSLSTPISEDKHFVDNPGADYVKTAIDAIADLNTQLEAAASWIEKQ